MKRPAKTAAVSAVILVTIAFQTMAAFDFRPGIIDGDPFLWPFLSYPMYSRVHYPGDSIQRPTVFAVLADARQVGVTPRTLDTDYWIWKRGLADALLSGSRDLDTIDELRDLAGLLERRHGYDVVGFRVENRPLILTRDGLLEGSVEHGTVLLLEPGSEP